MTNTQTVRKVYPDLPPQDREIFRTIISLSALLLKSFQEQKDAASNHEDQD